MRVCCQVAHRTLSDALGPRATNQTLSGIQWARSAIIHRTVRCAPDMSGEPVEQRLLARQRSTAKVNSDEQCHAEVRASKSEVTGHVWCATGPSGAAKGQRIPTINSSKLQQAR
jgi:hypothetical protein